MAVIINEFEVIPQQEPQAPTNSTEAPASIAQDTLPQQVDSVLRLRFQRAIRICAD